MKRLLFLIFTSVLAVVFLVAVWQDTNRGWTHYQRRFVRTLERDQRRKIPTGIQQIIVKDLERVDRCTTCHIAVDRPQFALGEEPFKAHPGKFLEWHPPEKFGCTVCHGGQGLATEVAAAHGDVPNWEEPLLRGPLVQASCRQCHGDLKPIRQYVPVLAKGMDLFSAKGCYGCHAVKEFGQTVSMELTEVGSKSHLLMEADFENMDPPHDRIHWLMTKLHHPRMLNPGVRPDRLPPGEEEVYPSFMPYFGLSDEETQALTTYLLSLTSTDYPASYVRQALPTPTPVFATLVEHGKAVYEKYGCAACHGIGGVGGRHNWNSGLGQEAPPLLYVKAYYGNDIDSLKSLIRNGRQPVPRADANRPAPAVFMPAWKDRIGQDDLDALVAYLFSLSDRLPPVEPAPAANNAPATNQTQSRAPTQRAPHS